MIFLGTDECGARVRHQTAECEHNTAEKRHKKTFISKYQHSSDVFQRKGMRMWLENGRYI